MSQRYAGLLNVVQAFNRTGTTYILEESQKSKMTHIIGLSLLAVAVFFVVVVVFVDSDGFLVMKIFAIHNPFPSSRQKKKKIKNPSYAQVGPKIGYFCTTRLVLPESNRDGKQNQCSVA
jgi:hypothetical protein